MAIDVKTTWQRINAFVQDPHRVGMVVFLVIFALVVSSSLRTVQRNIELQQQIARLAQDVAQAEFDNERQRLNNQYLQSDRYLELEARRTLGKALPGESVVIIPVDVAQSYIQPVSDPEPELTVDSRPKAIQNASEWVNFLLGRD